MALAPAVVSEKRSARAGAGGVVGWPRGRPTRWARANICSRSMSTTADAGDAHDGAASVVDGGHRCRRHHRSVRPIWVRSDPSRPRSAHADPPADAKRGNGKRLGGKAAGKADTRNGCAVCIVQVHTAAALARGRDDRRPHAGAVAPYARSERACEDDAQHRELR